MLSYVFNNQLDKLVDFLSDRIKSLKLSGVDYGAIASNTPHIVYDKLAEKTTIALISIVDETCKMICINKLRRVGLFGTKSTMINGFYNRAAERFGIDFIIPDSNRQDYIHNKYMSELIFNKILPDTKQQLIEIVKN